MNITHLPPLGQPIDAGLFAGITTRPDGAHCAVVLLPAKPDKRLHWQAAMDWAAEAGGELPTRPVAAMLFANTRSEFEEAWHWTSEADEDDGSYAWLQGFDDGLQGTSHESFEGRARAVRLIPLTA